MPEFHMQNIRQSLPTRRPTLGSAVELANHRAVREYRGKISSQRKGPFFDHIWV